MKRFLTLTLMAASLMQMQAQSTLTMTVTTERQQTVTGFGAAAMEHLMRPVDDVDIINKAFDPEGPIALNILRMEMSPNLKGDISVADIGWDTPYDWHGYLPAVREAKRLGAMIMATPWSPPASYKTNNSNTGGQESGVHGKLKSPEKLFTWFNTFLNYMQLNDAAVDVVSIQNEPDWWVSYSGCEYTPQEQHDLVRDYAKRLNKTKYNVRLMSAEPLGFNPEYARLLMEDEETAQYIDILAGHVYGNYSCKKNLRATANYAGGREVWMTEHTVNPRGDAAGIRDVPTWAEQLEFVEDVHECLLNGVTAYVYWYLVKDFGFIGDGTKFDQKTCLRPELNTRGEILDRGRLMGQFARNLKGATRLTTSSNLKDGSDTPGVNRRFEMSAFVKGDSMIVNVIDTLSRDYYLDITLPYNVSSAHQIQSTEQTICAEQDLTIEPGKRVKFLIPGRSFTTFIFHIDDDMQGISDTRVTDDNAQRGDCYDLQGRRVSNPRRGIYIRNGRKVVQ